jgi:hypothetical protein
LLSATAVTKAIVSRLPKRASPPTPIEVEAKLNEFAASLNDGRLEWAEPTSKQARAAIDARIQSVGLLACVSGKAVIQKLLFAWVQAQFGVSLNTLAIIRHFTADEIDSEMNAVLTAIENATFLPTRSSLAARSVSARRSNCQFEPFKTVGEY